MTTANVLDTIQPAAARSHGSDPSGRLYGGRKARDRDAASAAEADGRKRHHHEDVHISKTALTAIIQQYTQEAGLRQLEREIGRICRKVARRIAEGHKGAVRVSLKNLHEFLGAPKIIPEEVLKKDQIGVATGLGLDSSGRRRALHRGAPNEREGQSGA